MLFYSSRIPYISLKQIMFQVFFPSLYHWYWNQTWCNEIMELPVCVQKEIDFFCTKITFLHFWYIFNYLYSTTVLHFMCSVYADQFSSVLLNDKSTNIVLLHKSFILFASIQSINIVYFNLEAFCCFFFTISFWLVSFATVNFFPEHHLFPFNSQ